MTSILVSVIVPVYNVESVLPRCVESIRKQTYENLEIILVNDGSTDKCGAICDEYTNIDNRIKVIHKTNGGLSDARNAGLMIAQGDYISFVDSDDFIVNSAYERLIREAVDKELDIIAANALLINNNCNENPLLKKKLFPEGVITGIEYMCYSIKQNSFNACVWLNIYKRSLLINNNLFFQRGILHEDEEWTPKVFLEAKRVRYIDFKYYMYVVREGSISKSKDMSKNGIDILNTCYKLERIYKERLDKKDRRILNGHLLNIFFGAIYMGRLYKPEYKIHIKKTFVFDKINNFKNFFKTILFIINLRVYYEVNNLSKIIRIGVDW